MKKRIFNTICSLILTVSIFITGFSVYGDMIKKEDITKLEDELEAIKKRQEETEKALAEIEKDENFVESSIAFSQDLIDGYADYVKMLSDIIAEYDRAISETESNIEKLKAKYDDVYRVYLVRLRAAREGNAYSLLELVFTSESLVELIKSAERAADAIDYDKRIIKKLENQKRELAIELEEQEALKQGQVEQIEGYEALKSTVKERVDELYAQLLELKDKKDEAEEQKTLDDLLEEEADKALDELIAAYEKQLATTAEYADGEKMRWPLDSKWNYVSSYFGYRLHPVHKVWKGHKGLDIPANGGSNIYAALSGKVVTSVYSPSYGYYIIIDHGVYGNTGKHLYTLYAHCKKLYAKSGQMVKQGDRIALVGTTGTSTGNHLHFEVKLGTNPVDPLEGYVTRPK